MEPSPFFSTPSVFVDLIGISGFEIIVAKHTDPGSAVSNGVGYVLSTHAVASGGLRLYLRRDDSSRINCDGPSGVDVRDGAWHHVVVSARWSHSAQIYVDESASLGCDISSIGDLSNEAPFTLGGSSNASQHLPASLDEVRFYDRALNADEIGRI